MLLANQNNFNSASIYLALIENVLNNVPEIGSESERLFDLILRDTKDLIKGDKTIYQIDRDNFEFISFLVDNHKDDIKNININDKVTAYRILKKYILEYSSDAVNEL